MLYFILFVCVLGWVQFWNTILKKFSFKIWNINIINTRYLSILFDKTDNEYIKRFDDKCTVSLTDNRPFRTSTKYYQTDTRVEYYFQAAYFDWVNVVQK